VRWQHRSGRMLAPTASRRSPEQSRRDARVTASVIEQALSQPPRLAGRRARAELRGQRVGTNRLDAEFIGDCSSASALAHTSGSCDSRSTSRCGRRGAPAVRSGIDSPGGGGGVEGGGGGGGGWGGARGGGGGGGGVGGGGGGGRGGGGGGGGGKTQDKTQQKKPNIRGVGGGGGVGEGLWGGGGETTKNTKKKNKKTKPPQTTPPHPPTPPPPTHPPPTATSAFLLSSTISEPAIDESYLRECRERDQDRPLVRGLDDERPRHRGRCLHVIARAPLRHTTSVPRHRDGRSARDWPLRGWETPFAHGYMVSRCRCRASRRAG